MAALHQSTDVLIYNILALFKKNFRENAVETATWRFKFAFFLNQSTQSMVCWVFYIQNKVWASEVFRTVGQWDGM